MKVIWMVLGVVLLLLILYSGVPVLLTRVFHAWSHRRTAQVGQVALTFDDGPHPTYTPQLLDALRVHDVKATFFVIVDQARLYPDIVQRMVAEGHDVQVHGYQHWFVTLLDPWTTVRQCVRSRRDLERQFGVQSSVYRPPWGACNAFALYLMRKHHMKMCLWNVMVGDWRVTPAEEIVRRIEKKFTRDAIIVLHDNGNFGAQREAPERVIEAIPGIVQLVKSRGCEFARISECI